MVAAILEASKITDRYQYRGSVESLFEQVVTDYPKLIPYRKSFDRALEFLIVKRIAVPHRHSGIQDYVVIDHSHSVEAAFLETPETTEDLSSIFEGLFGPKNWKYHIVGSYLELGYEWLDDYINTRFDTEQADGAGRDIPASDRIVRLDHNRPEYSEIKEALDEAIESAKSTRPNEVSGDEHASLVAGLEGARSLWGAFELTHLQVKVGIYLAIESAENALKTSFQLVKGPLLMEALKAFFRSVKNGDIF